MGPLAGIRVVEFEAIGPGPFAGMLLADMGADVLLVDRPIAIDIGMNRPRKIGPMNRGKRSVTIDLKTASGVEAALDLVGRADALIEGARPGTMERLGLGPDVALERNPKLVYGRMTGWGQNGPLAARAGHDINYIALSGALAAIGRNGGPPVPPLNLLGDFGGGGMLLGFGIACALLEARSSGKGQIIDAAMVEGASLLAASFSGMLATQSWNEERGTNILDTGAPWYDVYETADGHYVSIGAIEARFYDELLVRLNLAGEALPGQHDRAGWPILRNRFAEIFKSKTREQWVNTFSGSDACFAPVLTFTEARRDPHNIARSAFTTVGGVEQPSPAPKFSRTPPDVPREPPDRGEGGGQALLDWGFSVAELETLRSQGLQFSV